MNRSQRVLVLATLLVSALVLHLWNLRWGFGSDTPWWPERNRGGFATVSWDSPAEFPEDFERLGPESELKGYNDSSGYRDPILERIREWVRQEWLVYKVLGKPEPWMDYLRSRHRETHYFGLWSTGRDENSWVWGIFAPLGILTAAAYLLLGRKPQSTR